MRASKESAKLAIEALLEMKKDHHVSTFHGSRWELILTFVESAAKALPTQRAIDRDRIRKKDLAR